ncbi:MAG: hypothetical protein JST01_13730 [Cyanobacteria bacterium SZAS TMP-1]|nr:hypothetical protein [Cyanobacteria bacterium SZAS TMP-1]
MAAVEKRRTNRSSGSLAAEQEHSIELHMEDGKIESRRSREANIQATPPDLSGHTLKAGLIYQENPIKNPGVQNMEDVEQKFRGVAAGLGEAAIENIAHLAKDPEATNKALAQNIHKLGEGIVHTVDKVSKEGLGALVDDAAKIGQGIVEASDRYSAMSQYEQGRFIGKEVMPDFIPDLPQVVQEIKGAQRVQGAIIYEAPHTPKSGEDRLPAGKGGEWPSINDRKASDVVLQTDKESCVSACGEMISEGRLKQADLIGKLGTPADLLELADHLGPKWTSGNFDLRLPDALLHRAPFVVNLREHNKGFKRLQSSHAVVVDGVDEAGNIKIRDPQDGERYEMTRKDFEHHWTGEAVFRRVP